MGSQKNNSTDVSAADNIKILLIMTSKALLTNQKVSLSAAL